MNRGSRVARRYARALFEAAAAAGVEAEVGRDLRRATTAVWGDAALRSFLLGARVPQEAKKQAIGTLLGEEARALLRGFFFLVIEKRREGELVEIARVYAALEDAAAGVTDVVVVTAVSLEKGARESLGASLERKLGRLRLSFETDPSLIGGVKIRAGGRILDASLKRRMQKLGEHLAKARVGG